MAPAERCERCGGRVYALWRKPGTTLTLPLCQTHNGEHRAALLENGWAVNLHALADR